MSTRGRKRERERDSEKERGRDGQTDRRRETGKENGIVPAWKRVGKFSRYRGIKSGKERMVMYCSLSLFRSFNNNKEICFYGY